MKAKKNMPLNELTKQNKIDYLNNLIVIKQINDNQITLDITNTSENFKKESKITNYLYEYDSTKRHDGKYNPAKWNKSSLYDFILLCCGYNVNQIANNLLTFNNKEALVNHVFNEFNTKEHAFYDASLTQLISEINNACELIRNKPLDFIINTTLTLKQQAMAKLKLIYWVQ